MFTEHSVFAANVTFCEMPKDISRSNSGLVNLHIFDIHLVACLNFFCDLNPFPLHLAFFYSWLEKTKT